MRQSLSPTSRIRRSQRPHRQIRRVNGGAQVPLTQNGDPNAIQPSYGIFDASVGIGPADGRWNFSIYGQNLFDKRFVTNVFFVQLLGGPQGLFQNFSSDSFRRYGVKASVRF
ncbi:TonB-dependent receptor [Sphingobium phenoxybenzoativorans]|uniref:TonB-dependent receptor n=1 Tax=Sphingobium phenoxybenzoativorans TaxID=1592790 RepID=A0A975Q3K6_9SPHN|nr:TonB-dependent receptor [Sphingobium phenoxybenzoativorans]